MIVFRDRLFIVAGGLLVLLMVLPLAAMILDLTRLGLPHLTPAFLLEAPQNAGRAGGVAPLLVSTGWILLVCLAVAVPIGIGCAVFLTEWLTPRSQTARAMGLSLDILSGVPSIIFGLFGYQVFAITMGMGFSILSGGLALACMVLPLLVRTAQQALVAVPAGYRDAGRALALSRSRMLWRIILPQAAPGLVAGIILATGRALGETAVLLFTAGYVMRMPGSVTDSGRALSVHIYDLATNVTGGLGMAAATALLLLALILVITLGLHFSARGWQQRMLSMPE